MVFVAWCIMCRACTVRCSTALAACPLCSMIVLRALCASVSFFALSGTCTHPRTHAHATDR